LAGGEIFLEAFYDCADERFVGDMDTDRNERQRPPVADPGSSVRSAICEMTMSQMEVESVWRAARQQARRTSKHVDVCLVEDDPSMVGMVRVLLEPSGIDLLAVDSCEGAILALRYNRPRLLLVDLGLPDRSGLEIARIVRGWCDYPHIPIVALTGSAERAGAAWRAGFSGFIAKPFVPKTFQTMVQSWVSALSH
jgi:CheY-like chemotaxis protein